MNHNVGVPRRVVWVRRDPRALHPGHPPVPLEGRPGAPRPPDTSSRGQAALGTAVSQNKPKHQRINRAAQVSAGRLGAIVSLTFRIVPNDTIRRSVTDTSVATFLGTLRAAADGLRAAGPASPAGAEGTDAAVPSRALLCPPPRPRPVPTDRPCVRRVRPRAVRALDGHQYLWHIVRGDSSRAALWDVQLTWPDGRAPAPLPPPDRSGAKTLRLPPCAVALCCHCGVLLLPCDSCACCCVLSLLQIRSCPARRPPRAPSAD